jgi:mannose-6-phosphate isomerase-like protein (cupin superfamily)
VPEKKYAKCVVEIKDPSFQRGLFEGKVTNIFELGTKNYPDSKLWMHSCIAYAPGAGYGCGDDWEKNKPDGTVEKIKASRHRHPHDEVFLFLGTDPHNPWDLGGEVEMWLGLGEDEEMYRFTRSTMIYVPANTWHAPMWFRKVDRPFILVVIGLFTAYYTEGGGTARYLEKSQVYPPSFVEEYGSILKQFGGPGE